MSTASDVATTDTQVEVEWVANATFPERPEELSQITTIEAALTYGMDFRQTVHFYGDHGIGKTSKIKDYFEQQGILVNYINLANITPDDKLVVAPVTGADGKMSLRQLRMEDLSPGVPFAIVLDDARQASAKVQNQFMQLTNDWSLGQQDIPDLVAVVMLDNEGSAEGIRTQEDFAVGDRKVTIRLGANDTGWRYALAAKYQDTDLTKVFEVWDLLHRDIKHTLSPRTLDHVIYCALNGFPPIYGLPIVGDNRQRLERGFGSSHTDETDSILRQIAAALNVPFRDSIADPVRKAVQAALQDGLAIMIQGPPGIGKTAIVKEMIRNANMREVYYSMPFTDPETLIVPMPTRDGTLTALIAEELRNPTRDDYAIIWDEYNRPSSQAAFAKLMEITQEWTLAGIPLHGCRAQIALCNPREWLGRQMQVASGNIAQGDRFTISIQVEEKDIPANEWLLNHWPDTVANGDPERRAQAAWTMEAILEWYNFDLEDVHRQWITKRTIQRLAQLNMAGMPLEYAKIYLGEGEYAPVPLMDLEARLAKRPMTRLHEMATNLDAWIVKLREASETSTVGTNDVDMVHQALAVAQVSQLREYQSAVLALFKELPRKARITFFTQQEEERREFWFEISHAYGQELEQRAATEKKGRKKRTSQQTLL